MPDAETPPTAVQPPAAAPAKNARWRLQFSLRTLLIVVLLIGSAGGLWWRWEPWVPERPPYGSEWPPPSVRAADGRTLWLRWGDDGTVRYAYVAKGGKEVLVLDRTDATTSMAFSPDGRRILTGYKNGIAQVWDAQTGAELLSLKGHVRDIRHVAFSPDGQRIAMAAMDNTARIWDARTGKELLCYQGHLGWVTSVAFSPDGRRVVSASIDNSARVWDASTGADVCCLKGHTSYVLSAAFTPDGQRIVTSGQDAAVRVWDAGTGRELCTLSTEGITIHLVYFSSDGRRILAGCSTLVLSWFRRRSEYAWGVLVLPELWLTVVLAPLLVWSVWRDRRGR